MVEHWTSTMIRLLLQSVKSHELIDISRYLCASILLLIKTEVNCISTRLPQFFPTIIWLCLQVLPVWNRPKCETVGTETLRRSSERKYETFKLHKVSLVFSWHWMLSVLHHLRLPVVYRFRISWWVVIPQQENKSQRKKKRR